MRRLIIGIDLSFNSTGLSIHLAENGASLSMNFYRLVFSDRANGGVPDPIKNIHQQVYRMPVNVEVGDLIESTDLDMYTEDQAHITLKAMVCCKRLTRIIVDEVTASEAGEVVFNIEGFIMPSQAGAQQLRVIGGLIMLQGMLRAEIIRLKMSLPARSFKMYVTSPSELKLFFTGNGSADKDMMLGSFLSTFGGAALLPDTSSLGRVNDVIDAFALCLNAHWRLNTERARKLSATQRKMEAAKLAKKTGEPKKAKKTRRSDPPVTAIWIV